MIKRVGILRLSFCHKEGAEMNSVTDMDVELTSSIRVNEHRIEIEGILSPDHAVALLNWGNGINLRSSSQLFTSDCSGVKELKDTTYGLMVEVNVRRDRGDGSRLTQEDLDELSRIMGERIE